MNQKNTRRGFTLIELLVVVLIIGILAAVAVPQYQVAVAKSRVAAIMPIVTALKKAEKTYYLENGEYTTIAQDLDLDIPCTKSVRAEDDAQFWTCGKDFLVQAGTDSIYANYCPNHNDSFEECDSVRDFQIGAHYAGRGFCFVKNNSKFGESICKNLGEKKEEGKYLMY